MKYVLVFLSVFSLVTISNVASQVTTRPTKIILSVSPNPATIPTIPTTVSVQPSLSRTCNLILNLMQDYDPSLQNSSSSQYADISQRIQNFVMIFCKYINLNVL